MAFTPRPIDDCVAAFRAWRPDQSLREQSAQHYDAVTAWSFSDLRELPDAPPLTSLYRMGDPSSHSAEVLTNPKSFADYCSGFQPAVGLWNANGSGRWVHGGTDWILLDVELADGQGDDEWGDDGGVAVVFGLWKIEEGWAAAVFSPDEKQHLTRVMGLDAWPSEGWEACDVWFGE